MYKRQLVNRISLCTKSEPNSISTMILKQKKKEEGVQTDQIQPRQMVSNLFHTCIAFNILIFRMNQLLYIYPFDLVLEDVNVIT